MRYWKLCFTERLKLKLFLSQFKRYFSSFFLTLIFCSFTCVLTFYGTELERSTRIMAQCLWGSFLCSLTALSWQETRGKSCFLILKTLYHNYVFAFADFTNEISERLISIIVFLYLIDWFSGIIFWWKEIC